MRSRDFAAQSSVESSERSTDHRVLRCESSAHRFYEPLLLFSDFAFENRTKQAVHLFRQKNGCLRNASKSSASRRECSSALFGSSSTRFSGLRPRRSLGLNLRRRQSTIESERGLSIPEHSPETDKTLSLPRGSTTKTSSSSRIQL